MPRHILKPLPRGNLPARAGPSGSRQVNVGMDWSKLDRVQVLGTGRADDGHTGYALPSVFYGEVKLGQHQADGKMRKCPILVGRWRYPSLRLRRQAVRSHHIITSKLTARVCIWTPDSSSPIASSSTSPHPMKLSSSFHTGHGANIFSAKFLPNAGTPTIVTVAGDHEIRLLEIERLSASGHRPERWEHGGAG
jgi:hypothetical protein